MHTMTRTVLFLLLISLTSVSPLAAQPLGSWERVVHRTEFTLWDVAFADSLRGSVVGDYGVIMRTTDGGNSWTQQLSSDQFAFRNLHYFDDSVGVASGFRGTFHRTTDAGASWTRIALPDARNYPGMAVAGSTVWLCGEEGSILKSTDRGSTWTALESGVDLMLGSISFADARHGWCASVQRTLLHTSDGGATWKEQPLDSFLPVTTVRARSPQECWLAGYRGLVMRTTDGGANWQRIPAYDTDYVRLVFDGTGRGWAVGKRGAVVRGEQNNMQWKLHDLTAAKTLHGITFLPNDRAVAVGEFGAVYLLEDVDPASPVPGK